MTKKVSQLDMREVELPLCLREVWLLVKECHIWFVPCFLESLSSRTHTNNMGNQNSLATNNLSYQIPSTGPTAQPISSESAVTSSEPLESYIKEKQRDDHLKNLGFKRSKSLRKSISKRLKRKNKHKQNAAAAGAPDAEAAEEAAPPRVEEPPQSAVDIIQSAPKPVAPAASAATTATAESLPTKSLKKVDNRNRNPGGSVERIDRTQDVDPIPEPVVKQKVPTAIAKKTKKRPLVGEPEPMPSHVQVGSSSSISTFLVLPCIKRSQLKVSLYSLLRLTRISERREFRHIYWEKKEWLIELRESIFGGLLADWLTCRSAYDGREKKSTGLVSVNEREREREKKKRWRKIMSHFWWDCRACSLGISFISFFSRTAW